MPRKPISEASFTIRVIKAARSNDWQVMHVPDEAMRSAQCPGFPDLVLAHQPCGRLIVAELKTNNRQSRPTPEQKFWLKAFKTTATPTFIWRPTDYPLIEQLLSNCLHCKEIYHG